MKLHYIEKNSKKSKIKKLKKAIIKLKQTDNYLETKKIIKEIYHILDWKDLYLRRACITTKMRLRRGFLDKLDSSRAEVVKMITKIENFVNSYEEFF